MKAKTLDPGYLESQYEFEVQFRNALLAEPSFEERQQMYVQAYGTAYQSSADLSPDEVDFGFVSAEMDCITPWLADKTVVDYGCGYGSSTLYAARFAKHVIGCDILDGVISVASQRLQDLSEARLIQGSVEFRAVAPASFDFAPNSIDGVYASDVVEHFHPDDFDYWLKAVYSALRPGGWLCVITPHRCYGPSDISKHFVADGVQLQSVSEGFHIIEYDYNDLSDLLSNTGLSHLKTPILSPRQLSQVASWKHSSIWGLDAWTNSERLREKPDSDGFKATT